MTPEEKELHEFFASILSEKAKEKFDRLMEIKEKGHFIGKWRYPECAKHTGLSQATLRGYVMSRRIPHIKLNRSVLFDPEEIEKWIQFNSIPVRR